jgi:pilus assembly protein Flp/PilA
MDYPRPRPVDDVFGTSAVESCPRASRTVGLPNQLPGFIRHMPALISYIAASIASRLRREEGQGLAEYALILALIAIVAIVALIFLGGKVSQILSNVGRSI